MPFLRERTDLPEKLDRPDLKKIFDKLTGQDKQRLTKLADDVSAKFDKYYTEYQQAKGVEDINSIENYISHIWNLDKKQKSLLIGSHLGQIKNNLQQGCFFICLYVGFKKNLIN